MAVNIDCFVLIKLLYCILLKGNRYIVRGYVIFKMKHCKWRICKFNVSIQILVTRDHAGAADFMQGTLKFSIKSLIFIFIEMVDRIHC